MKLPRLEYTYMVFYMRSISSTSGLGRTQVTADFKIKSLEDIEKIENEITEINNYHKTSITNYKLLSVRIVWE